MKKSIVLSVLILISILCYSQIVFDPECWSTATQESAFNGNNKSAFIVGTCYDGYVDTPVLSVSKTEGQEVQIYLAYFPVAICGNTYAFFKIDAGEIYRTIATYNVSARMYTLKFDSSSGISKKDFIAKLKGGEILHLRFKNDCLQTDVDFSLYGSTSALNFIEK